MPEAFVNKRANPSATTLTDLYTVPASTKTAVSKIVVANRSATATSFRLALAPLGAADDPSHYLAYDVPIAGNDVYEGFQGLALIATDKLRCYATLATLSFNLSGAEIT